MILSEEQKLERENNKLYNSVKYAQESKLCDETFLFYGSKNQEINFQCMISNCFFESSKIRRAHVYLESWNDGTFAKLIAIGIHYLVLVLIENEIINWKFERPLLLKIYSLFMLLFKKNTNVLNWSYMMKV